MTTGTDWAEITQRLRQLKNWSQQELSERLGVHVGTISCWERGTQVPIKCFRQWIRAELAKLEEHA